eukprot:TRINITY_DN8143_c0_g2_i1.p1 TRINITY_DN8143_c0_g2~~TRINITY_DN8143_c0_g2_i1.p1  ORF type:complete len:362 (-),score=87.99 TRINITY_DN8143_c0_g2_i1:67-996(-)
MEEKTDSETQAEKVKIAAQILHEADALVITAGAGMGVDSGLPDFRGNEGFWKNYPPMKRLGLSFYEMANPKWFVEDPELAWGFYGHRFLLYRDTVPHRGFEILKNIGAKKPFQNFIFTSNVDGQFHKSGFDENSIYECHGSLTHLQCLEERTGGKKKGLEFIWPFPSDFSIQIDPDTFRAIGDLPVCKCGGLARPNMLLFGDYNWQDQRSAEQRGRYEKWVENVFKKKAKLAVVELGAGNSVPTVRHQTESLWSRNKANVRAIRINPREAEFSKNMIVKSEPNQHVSLFSGALSALELIEKELGSLGNN